MAGDRNTTVVFCSSDAAVNHPLPGEYRHRRGWPVTRTFGELLIDCEEDRTLRPVLIGMLRESERRP